MLRLDHIRKEYPGTVALDDVSIAFERSSVHALLGKNGAGKSTLVKILSGAVRPTSGRILLDGEEIVLDSPADAFRKGIAAVYQEPSLLPDLTVAENILLGRLPKKGTGIVIDWEAAFRKAEEVLLEMAVRLDVRMKASRLGVAQQQIAELAKAMAGHPGVLLLDEPTSALAHHETDSLFAVLRRLVEKGVSVVYITHRLNEVREIADTVSILRDGAHVGTLRGAEATSVNIVSMMFGGIPAKSTPSAPQTAAETVLEVRDLHREGRFSGISFRLRRGEVLGIAGMLGSGRTELLRAIAGADRRGGGELILAGVSLGEIGPAEAKRLGIAFVSENRKEEGLIGMLSTRLNMCLASYDRISRSGVLTEADEQRVVERYAGQLDITVPDASREVSSLSGGNQQKVVLAKWLNINPKVMLLDEPTRGIDMQTKQHIYRIIADLSAGGIGVIIVSTELEELLEVCHRILIMKKGRMTSEVLPGEVSADELFVRCMEQ